MDIIDFHAHIYPEKIAEKAVQSVGDFYTLKMECAGTAADLLEKGRAQNIVGYVVHSVATTADRVQTINNYIASECEAHKEFFGFAAMHPEFDDKISEVERSINLGLRGVKIHPDTQKFPMDDERMFELYDYLSQMKLPILIHCGDYRYDYSHPRRLKRLLHEFPNLTVIGAHFGGWSLFDLAYEYLSSENCYLDTSSSFEMLGKKRAKELIRLYGAERMVFGTDFPMWNVDKELKTFFDLGLSEEENNLILHGNAEKILKLEV